MNTLTIKIHTPKPSDELLNALANARLNYSTPADLFHLIWLGDGSYCGVFGDGDNGGYEWFTWDGSKLEHSDVAYGGTEYALRDVLAKVVV